MGRGLPVETAQFPSVETLATPVVDCPGETCSAVPIQKTLLLVRTLHGIQTTTVPKKILRNVGDICAPEAQTRSQRAND